MKLRWQLLLLIALLAASTLVAPAGGPDGGPLYVSADLKNASFEEALRQLFSGPMRGYVNYVVESGPAEGAAATIKLPERTQAFDALTQVLGQYGLSYRWVGRTVYVFRKGEQPVPEEGLLLYLRRNGDRMQLRLRAYPYERGGEKLLWESPKDVFQDAYIVPSPSFRYVVVVWRGETYFMDAPEEGPWLLLVPVAGGAAERIRVPQAAESVVWTKDDEFDIAGEENGHWRYHLSTRKLTSEAPKGEELSKVAYADQIRALEGLLSKTKLPFAFPTTGLEWYVQAAVTDALNDGMNTLAPPQAAVSADGRYAALVGAEAAVYVFEVATAAMVQKIPATRLVDTEGVALGQLHWSPDSARLLFTESHFHAARFHGPGGPVGRMPSVTDWTDLVREYTPAMAQTKTLTIGFDAYRVSAEAAKAILAKSNPRDWQAADDQQRWGRYASEDGEAE